MIPEDTTNNELMLSRGSFLFLGLLGGFFLAAVLAVTVLISLGDGGQTPTGSATVTTISSTDDPVTGDAVAGEAVFSSTCVACHGPSGEGVPGLGPSFAGNVFVAGSTDDDMVAFLKVGRPTDDPANTTGVAMPPKGGNPSLTDDDLRDVTAFLRSIN